MDVGGTTAGGLVAKSREMGTAGSGSTRGCSGVLLGIGMSHRADGCVRDTGMDFAHPSLGRPS